MESSEGLKRFSGQRYREASIELEWVKPYSGQLEGSGHETNSLQGRGTKLAEIAYEPA